MCTGDRIARRAQEHDTSLGALLSYLEENLAFVRQHAAHVRAAMEVAANLRRPEGGLALAPTRAEPVVARGATDPGFDHAAFTRALQQFTQRAVEVRR